MYVPSDYIAVCVRVEFCVGLKFVEVQVPVTKKKNLLGYFFRLFYFMTFQLHLCLNK